MDETETKINKNLTINSEKKDTALQVLQNTRNSEKKEYLNFGKWYSVLFANNSR